jgi:methyltransferase (TIGR00027 family)
MIDDKPSQTALHVAAARAAHLRFDPPPHLLEDRCAEPLLGDQADELIESYADSGSWLLLENRLAIPLRARYLEDRLTKAYQSGVRQLVVLGAGLDSYAFRRPTEQAELAIFEVDHPNTQRWKTARLAQLGWSPPPNLAFVPCDFESEDVSTALRDTRYKPTQPAVISWMGVTYYLTPETTHRALCDLHALLAPGSEVVFDFQYPLETLSERYRAVPATLDRYLSQVGEPQYNRYRREALIAAGWDAGFAEVLVEPRDALEAAYYAPLRSAIPMSERFGLAVATRGRGEATRPGRDRLP